MTIKAGHPLISEAKRIGEERRARAQAYKGPPLPFTHMGNAREADMPWLSHEEAAGMVRMLLRSDLDHEAVCCMARDRILHLAQENERLVTALRAMVDAFKPFTMKPMGGPGSAARLEQEAQIKAHADAVALMRSVDVPSGK